MSQSRRAMVECMFEWGSTRKTQPFAKRVAYNGIWVEPKLLAEIEHRAKSPMEKSGTRSSEVCGKTCEGRSGESGVLGCGLRHHRRAIPDVSKKVLYCNVEGWCYQHVQDITVD